MTYMKAPRSWLTQEKGSINICHYFSLPNSECHEDRPCAFFTSIFLALHPRLGKENVDMGKPYFPDIYVWGGVVGTGSPLAY